jgi:hypothetical protein
MKQELASTEVVHKSHNTTRRILHLAIHLIKHTDVTEDDALRLLQDETGRMPSLPSFRKYIRTLNRVGFITQRFQRDQQVVYRLTENPFIGDVLHPQHTQAIEEVMASLPSGSSLHQKLAQFLPEKPFAFMSSPSRLNERFLNSIRQSSSSSVFATLLTSIEAQRMCGVVLFQSSSFSDRITTLWGVPYLCAPIGLRDALISFLHPIEKRLFHIKLSYIHQVLVPEQQKPSEFFRLEVVPEAILTLEARLLQRYQAKPDEIIHHETRELHITKELPFTLLRRLLKYDTLCSVSSPYALKEAHHTFTNLQHRMMQYQHTIINGE